MAARPLWKGQLRLSLVSIPVEIYSAVDTSTRISFRQIHEPTGKPVHYEKVVQGIGPVNVDDIMKGYKLDDGGYVLLKPDEVDAIRLETKKTFELVQFVGGCEISPLYYDKAYYLVAADKLAEDAYRVVRDALRQSEKIGLGQITMRGKEYLAAVKPCGDGLLLETLRYEDEIRKADPFFSSMSDERADKELLDVATTLIDKKTAPFDAKAFQDNFTVAMRDLIKAKTGSKKTKTVPPAEDERPARGDNVVDLMSALKASLEKSGGKAKAKPTRSKTTSSKTTGGKTAVSKTAGKKKRRA